MRVLPVILIPILLAACATHPKNIDAAYVSPFKYEGYDREQIAMEIDRVSQRLRELYKRLESDRAGDSWRFVAVFLIHPLLLLLLDGDDGPDAAEFARLKGDFEALWEVSVEKDCGAHERWSSHTDPRPSLSSRSELLRRIRYSLA